MNTETPTDALGIPTRISLNRLAHLTLENTSPNLARKYARRWRGGSKWPPLIAYVGRNGLVMLADGNNRLRAARRLELDEVEAMIYPTEAAARAAIEAAKPARKRP